MLGMPFENPSRSGDAEPVQRLGIMAQRLDAMLDGVAQALNDASTEPLAEILDMDAALDLEQKGVVATCHQLSRRWWVSPTRISRLLLVSSLARDLERIGDQVVLAMQLARLTGIAAGDPFWAATGRMAEGVRARVREAVDASLRGDSDAAMGARGRCRMIALQGSEIFGVLASAPAGERVGPAGAVAARAVIECLERITGIVSTLCDRVIQDSL